MFKKQKKLSDSIIIGLIAMIVVAGVFGVIWSILNNGTETYSSTTSTTTIDYLYCKSSLPQNPFFDSEEDKSATHEVKIAFSGNDIGKATYTYTGIFYDEATAKKETEKFRSQLYKLMGQLSMGVSDLSPGFSYDGNKGVANLFIESQYLNSETAKVIMLTEEDLALNGQENALEKLKTVYAEKGFTCEVSK